MYQITVTGVGMGIGVGDQINCHTVLALKDFLMTNNLKLVLMRKIIHTASFKHHLHILPPMHSRYGSVNATYFDWLHLQLLHGVYWTTVGNL